MYHNCNCGGQYQEDYKHTLTKVTIKLYYKSQKFTARTRSSIVKQGNFDELQTFVKELFQEA